MRRLFALLAVALAASGCLNAFQGLEVVVVNETDAPVEGTLRLVRNDTGALVAERALQVGANGTALLERLTRDAGAFRLEVALADGRNATGIVHGGGTLPPPQVTIRAHEIIVFQDAVGKAPRGLS